MPRRPSARLAGCTIAFALVVVLFVLGADAQAQAAGVHLVSSCTASELLDVGIRTFRVDNSTGADASIRLVNTNSGVAVDGTAPPGSSFWDVQGGNGRANATQLFVDGVFVESKNSLNRSCDALTGNAECDPSTGVVTVTWTLTSFNGAPSTITSTSLSVTFSPNPLPTGGLGGSQSVATETLAGTAASTVRALNLTLDLLPSSRRASLSEGEVIRPLRLANCDLHRAAKRCRYDDREQRGRQCHEPGDG